MRMVSTGRPDDKAEGITARENYNGHRWDEIPKSLYDELVRYDESLKWISKVLGVQQKTSA